ncbi:MAG: hydantoinase/oxoprolinase family protein [Acidobacteriia bacterium]|nr:hydantoinase/oxoprolinase family protein [Terriglobia bacterium]
MNTIDVDTGGTFTDGVFRFEGTVVTTKVDTTPHNPVQCFVDCIESGAGLMGKDIQDLLQATDLIRYSTTAATNAIIQRKGARIGLLVTAGAEEGLYFEGQGGSPIWPLVEKTLVRGVRETVDGSGTLRTELDADSFRSAAEELLDNGARLLVIAFRNAALNPANERRAHELFRKWFPSHYLGTPFLLLSHEVSSRSGDAERLNSAVISGYLHRQLVVYLYKCDDAVRSRGYRHPLLVVHSSGGLARVAKTKALNTYNSGPTAGVFGASRIAQRYAFPHVVTMDMGGTSTDVAFIESGTVRLSFDVQIEGIPVNLPMIDVLGLGGGGGSLARIENGKLLVGPDSAGAVPGPACYDLGNERPTVTDADLALGLIDAGNFLGGRRRVNPERARQALQSALAGPLGVSVDEAALRVRQVLAGTLAEEIREEAKSRKYPLAEAVLFAYGGAGPLHAMDIASALGIRTFYMFPESPVFSAAGSSTMNVEHLYESRVRAHSGRSFTQVLEETVRGLRLRAQRDIRGEGFNPEQATVRAVVETMQGKIIPLNGSGGGPELGGLQDAIVRLTVTLPRSEREEAIAPVQGSGGGHTGSGQRDIAWADGRKMTPVVSLRAMEAGKKRQGPLTIETGETTCVVPAGWSAEKDAYGAIRVQRD